MTVEQLNEIRAAFKKIGIIFNANEIQLEENFFGKQIKIKGHFKLPKALSEGVSHAVSYNGDSVVSFDGALVIDSKPDPFKDLTGQKLG